MCLSTLSWRPRGGPQGNEPRRRAGEEAGEALWTATSSGAHTSIGWGGPRGATTADGSTGVAVWSSRLPEAAASWAAVKGEVR